MDDPAALLRMVWPLLLLAGIVWAIARRIRRPRPNDHSLPGAARDSAGPEKLVFLVAFLVVGVAAAAPGVVSTTQTSATVEGLDCESTYRIDIQKYAENGELSSSADSVDAQTKSCPDTQPPSAPQEPAATGQTQTSTSVSWSASAETVGVARCAVPDVRRRTVTRARAMLSARRCRLGRITRVYSRKVRKGRIIGQSRRPGARLPRGTRVAAAVSRGRRR